MTSVLALFKIQATWPWVMPATTTLTAPVLPVCASKLIVIQNKENRLRKNKDFIFIIFNLSMDYMLISLMNLMLFVSIILIKRAP
jgi:hypothetical protein